MNIIHVSIDNFEEVVLKSEKPVLVDFWAEWCGPCRMLGPELEKLASEHPEIQVVKVNVDENQALASQFKIRSIPAIYIFKDGKVVNTSLGFQPKDSLLGLF